MGACEARPEGYEDPFGDEEDDEQQAQRDLYAATSPTSYNRKADSLRRIQNKTRMLEALEAQFPNGVPKHWRAQLEQDEVARALPSAPRHTGDEGQTLGGTLDADLERTAQVYRGNMSDTEALAYGMAQSKKADSALHGEALFEALATGQLAWLELDETQVMEVAMEQSRQEQLTSQSRSARQHHWDCCPPLLPRFYSLPS